MEAAISMELENVSDWLTDNKLSLHLGNPDSILFASKKRLNHRKEISICCNGTNIVLKTNATYLGVTSDQQKFVWRNNSKQTNNKEYKQTQIPLKKQQKF